MREIKLPAGLSLDDEAVGVFGDGYPTSFYRAYVRVGARWYGFERTVHVARRSPLEMQAAIPVARRAAIAWGPLRHLLDYGHHPERPAVGVLLTHGRIMLETEADLRRFR